ncbi:hypothetical protein CTI12_AA577150 [Artemisia annua]|uniref:Uncharacterized protein n=1 Tax=Artemisia annua TaxID=35608 RepID=A0A2U1KQ73_ARTAN|nr:hypothetical protein CTI12_AA577150 [Artemisia annua]
MALPGTTKKSLACSKQTASQSGDVKKLKELYMLSLKAMDFSQLHAIYRLWLSENKSVIHYLQVATYAASNGALELCMSRTLHPRPEYHGNLTLSIPTEYRHMALFPVRAQPSLNQSTFAKRSLVNNHVLQPVKKFLGRTTWDRREYESIVKIDIFTPVNIAIMHYIWVEINPHPVLVPTNKSTGSGLNLKSTNS